MSKLKVNELDTESGTTITVAAGKTLAGTAIIDTTQIANDAITATQIEANAVGNSEMADDAVGVAELSATGTASATTFLRGDNAWQVPAGLPTQTSNAGKLLLTDGTDASWVSRPNKNYLINGQFDVWQRGTSFVYGSNTAHNYYMDRWRHEGAAWTGSVTQQTFTNGQTDVPGNPTYYARWIISAVDAGGVSTIQRLENYPLNRMSGKDITVSVWLKSVSGTIAAGDITIYGGGPLGEVGPTWTKYTKTATLATQAAAYGPSYGIQVATTVLLTSGIDIANFQVEDGSVATDYEQKTFGQELEACQRYYQKSYNQSIAPGSNSSPGACTSVAIYSSGSQGLGTRFSTTMRAAPTVVLYSPGGTSGGVSLTSNGSHVAATAGDIGDSGIQYVTGSLPSTNADGYRWHYTAEAEL